MSRIGFGWFLPNGPESPEARATFVADVDRNLQAVTGHFTSAWMADHLQAEMHDMLEAWTTLTYYAARHPALLFGHGVLCQSYRNPALLAKTAATFQYLTGGRLLFGLGAGWKEDEYLAYNYPFPSPGTRVAELGETLQIVKAMWTQEQATFEGQHYQVHAAYCEPKPDPIPPIVIGGRQPRILRLIAREADWWDVSGFSLARTDYPALVAEMDRACAEVGRDPQTLRRTFSASCACAPREAAVAALAEGMRPGRGFVGTPAQIVDQLRPFIDLGVDHFQLSFNGFPDTAPVELFIAEVLPALAAL
jgi:alkanesulfonate monooxygenase SsuD/methylene tetrahydromethanopterin reductase-like flavin-dependent oxidoreductase (luciferase family)